METQIFLLETRADGNRLTATVPASRVLYWDLDDLFSTVSDVLPENDLSITLNGKLAEMSFQVKSMDSEDIWRTTQAIARLAERLNIPFTPAHIRLKNCH